VSVGFGVLGLVTVIFSRLFLVVQWAFSSLSPWLTLFRDDPIVWRTFALAIGVFVFSVTTALATRAHCHSPPEIARSAGLQRVLAIPQASGTFIIAGVRLPALVVALLFTDARALGALADAILG
jgi:hypothetical protein